MKNNPKDFDFYEGEILLIDKPFEWTSFDVVNKIRRTISRHYGKKIKVGHAGTLDPLATGLLILCTGKFTKRINDLQLMEKEYTGSFYLGATTPSFDKETAIDHKYPVDHLNEAMIRSATQKFLGETEQIPPQFSAIKINGKRAYHSAREEKQVELKSRKIIISEFEILEVNLPEVIFRVKCSKGTYIRALARDFGKSMDTGAYLKSLRRTAIGSYKIDQSLTIFEFERLFQ